MRSSADIRIVTLLQNKVFFYVIYWEKKTTFLEVLVLIGKYNICTVNSQIDACIKSRSEISSRYIVNRF